MQPWSTSRPAHPSSNAATVASRRRIIPRGSLAAGLLELIQPVLLEVVLGRELLVALVAALDLLLLHEGLHRGLGLGLTALRARLLDQLGLEVLVDAGRRGVLRRRIERREREHAGDGHDAGNQSELGHRSRSLCCRYWLRRHRRGDYSVGGPVPGIVN